MRAMDRPTSRARGTRAKKNQPLPPLLRVNRWLRAVLYGFLAVLSPIVFYLLLQEIWRLLQR